MSTGSPGAPPPSPSASEKRRATRVRFRETDNLEVRYKFLSHLPAFQSDEIHSGTILNLSKGGALFEGTIPSIEWLPRLGEGSVLIGLNVLCPTLKPVKALATLRWTRAAGNDRYELGVQFEQIDPEHRTTLDRFLIGHQIKSRRMRRDGPE